LALAESMNRPSNSGKMDAFDSTNIRLQDQSAKRTDVWNEIITVRGLLQPISEHLNRRFLLLETRYNNRRPTALDGGLKADLLSFLRDLQLELPQATRTDVWKDIQKIIEDIRISGWSKLRMQKVLNAPLSARYDGLRTRYDNRLPTAVDGNLKADLILFLRELRERHNAELKQADCVVS
jgi:hypothetical protein